MVLFRPFLAYASQSQHQIPALLDATVAKCVDAAKRTIEIMYDTFCHHVFFRSWYVGIFQVRTMLISQVV